MAMGARKQRTSGPLRFFYLCSAAALVLYLFSARGPSGDPQAPGVLRGDPGGEAELDGQAWANGTASGPAKPRFSVRGAHCAMPYVDPFAPETMAVFQPMKAQNCSSGSRPMVESIFDANLRRYVLHIDEAAARTLANYSGDVRCCYREIVRKEDDDSDYHWLPCTTFHQEFAVPPHIEAMTVDCFSANGTKLLQQDGFAFVQLKALTNRTRRVTNTRKTSVLMFGMDALSRLNFQRNMVKTHAYLKRSRWYEMQGYNKMGDNTFPNLMAVLAGFDEEMAIERCRPRVDGGLDECPLVWKAFREVGYRTAYAEDESEMSTFNYCKNGFLRPPTDYYLRPYYMAFEDRLPGRRRCHLRDCLGLRPAAGYIYDYALQLARRYNDEPLFGFFWTNSFSHNCHNSAAALDDVVLAYLQELEESAVLETSIVILMSDHGTRYGLLNELPDGFFEERWPMLHVWLPRWFARQHPQFAEALRVNQNRLTSPYDLHMTLKHLVQLAGDDPGDSDSDSDSDSDALELVPAAKCPTCQSLFRPMSEDRSCSDAGIPEHWCSCVPYEVLDIDDRARSLASEAIAETYNYLVERGFGDLCAPLTLGHVKMMQRRMHLEGAEVETATTEAVIRYRIKYEVGQNEAVFEATVTHHERSGGIGVDVESISRLNSYEHDSQCVDDKQAKKYCICRDALQTTASE